MKSYHDIFLPSNQSYTDWASFDWQACLHTHNNKKWNEKKNLTQTDRNEMNQRKLTNSFYIKIWLVKEALRKKEEGDWKERMSEKKVYAWISPNAFFFFLPSLGEEIILLDLGDRLNLAVDKKQGGD